MDTHFDPDKLMELVVYVAAKSADDPNFGKRKLNKILCFCDFYAYAKLGRPITGATYRALDYGPVPSELTEVQHDLIERREAVVQVRDHFGKVQQRLIPLREPNLERFSGAEIALVDSVIEELRYRTAGAVSELSHRELVGWQLASYGAEIPYASIFLSPEPLTKADIACGQAFAAQHGWLDNAH